jgi:hypothetical protein
MSIANLHELLQHGQCDYRCYDLGRRVQPISNSEFAAMAEQRAPYPYPHQNHAHFALIFWPQLSNRPAPFIWLLRLPIDERGLLDQLARHPNAELRLALLHDLVRLPLLRPHLFAALRGHDKPNSIQQLWQQLRGEPACS